MKFKSVIMQCGTPNVNGRIYTKEVMEKCVEEYKNNGEMFGELSRSDDVATLDRMTVNLEHVSHKFNDLYFEGDNLIGEGEIFETPQGKMVSAIGLENFGTEIVGMTSGINDNGEVKDFILTHIDLIPKECCAFKESKIVEL